jgi:hypothetical protein
MTHGRAECSSLSFLELINQLSFQAPCHWDSWGAGWCGTWMMISTSSKARTACCEEGMRQGMSVNSCEDDIVVCVEDWYCQQLQCVQTEEQRETVQLIAHSKRLRPSVPAAFGSLKKSGEYSPERFRLAVSKRPTINTTNDQVRER